MKKMSRFFMFIESIFIKFTSIINKCKKMKYLQPYRFPTRHISTWEILKTKPHKSETAKEQDKNRSCSYYMYHISTCTLLSARQYLVQVQGLLDKTIKNEGRYCHG